MGDSVPFRPRSAWFFPLGDSQLANQSTTATAQSPLAQDMAGSDPCTMVESRIVQNCTVRSRPQANVVTPRLPEVPKASTCAAPKGRTEAAYHRVGENKFPPLTRATPASRPYNPHPEGVACYLDSCGQFPRPGPRTWESYAQSFKALCKS